MILKKTLFFIISFVSFSYAQVLDINSSGWKLLGAVESINPMNTFNKSCIQSVWSYKNGSWKAYSPNEYMAGAMQSLNYFDNNLTLVPGDGFWINTTSTCSETSQNGGFSLNMIENKVFYIVQTSSSSTEVWLDSLEVNASEVIWKEYMGNAFNSQSAGGSFAYSLQNGVLQFSNMVLTLINTTEDYLAVNATFASDISSMRFYTDATKALAYYDSLKSVNSADVMSIGNLMWQDNSDAASVIKAWIEFNKYYYQAENYDTSGDTATTYCANLVLGGFDDWRLPTRSELASTQGVGFANIASITSTNTPRYWTSEYAVNTPANAYAMRLTANSPMLVEVSAQKGSSFNVRCVRNSN